MNEQCEDRKRKESQVPPDAPEDILTLTGSKGIPCQRSIGSFIIFSIQIKMLKSLNSILKSSWKQILPIEL